MNPEKPSPKAIAAMICGFISLVYGFTAGIVAIIIGCKELKAIEEGRASRAGHSRAVAGIVLGAAGILFFFTSLTMQILGRVFKIWTRTFS
jgi:hypothetical protein